MQVEGIRGNVIWSREIEWKDSKALLAEVIKACEYCSPATQQPVKHIVTYKGHNLVGYMCMACCATYFYVGDETVRHLGEKEAETIRGKHKKPNRSKYEELYLTAVEEQWFLNLNLDEVEISGTSWTMAVEVAAQLYHKVHKGKAPGTSIGADLLGVAEVEVSADAFVQSLSYLKDRQYIK